MKVEWPHYFVFYSSKTGKQNNFFPFFFKVYLYNGAVSNWPRKQEGSIGTGKAENCE